MAKTIEVPVRLWEDLLDAACTGLPFVEDALDDSIYKAACTAKAARTIREVIFRATAIEIQREK